MVKNIFTFQSEKTATGNGLEYQITNTGSSETIVLSMVGTATSYTIHFEGIGDVGVYQGYGMYDNTNKTVEVSTTQAGGKLWTGDITGLTKFRVRISAVSGGDLTVVGKIVG
jgi:hypothetical protein